MFIFVQTRCKLNSSIGAAGLEFRPRASTRYSGIQIARIGLYSHSILQDHMVPKLTSIGESMTSFQAHATIVIIFRSFGEEIQLLLQKKHSAVKMLMHFLRTRLEEESRVIVQLSNDDRDYKVA